MSNTTIMLYALLTPSERVNLINLGVQDQPISDLRISDIRKLYTCISIDHDLPFPAVEIIALRCLMHRSEKYVLKKLMNS